MQWYISLALVALTGPVTAQFDGRYYTNETYGFTVSVPVSASVCPADEWVPNHGIRIVRTQADCAKEAFNLQETDISASYNVTGETSIAEIGKALCGSPPVLTAYKIGTDGVMLCRDMGSGKSYISLHQTGANVTDWIVYTLYIGKDVNTRRIPQIFAAIRHLK